jgi:hypothetical protein
VTNGVFLTKKKTIKKKKKKKKTNELRGANLIGSQHVLRPIPLAEAVIDNRPTDRRCHVTKAGKTARRDDDKTKSDFSLGNESLEIVFISTRHQRGRKTKI